MLTPRDPMPVEEMRSKATHFFAGAWMQAGAAWVGVQISKTSGGMADRLAPPPCTKSMAAGGRHLWMSVWSRH